MLEWRLPTVALQVGGAGRDEVPVFNEAQGGECIESDGEGARRVPERSGGDSDRGDDDEGGEQDPSRSAHQERHQVDLTRRVTLTNKDAGDQKPGEDEEEVDAGEPADGRTEEVVRENGENGDAAQALEIGAEVG